MNVETLSNFADKQIEKADSAFKLFRESHLANFREKGFSETVQDSYKFTNLESFFSSFKQELKLSKMVVDTSSNLPTITFLDGEFSTSQELPEGISVKKIKDHFHLAKDLFQEANPLSSLHHSLFSEGLLIEVAKNVEVNVALRILNLVTKSTITAPTHLIIANPFCKLTVLEETRALDVSHVILNETYIIAHPGSQVEHIKLEHESSEGINHSSVFAEIEKDASVKSCLFHAAGKLNRSNLILNLNAPGAKGESYSLFLTHGNEHSDINTNINHRAPDTTSTQIAKGILDGDSKGIFTGKIHIYPKAQRVTSTQLNKNLLLSKKAQVHSQPQLEIFADDVKCSHGSTTGQLSPDEVFYFQARGIPLNKARSILAHGFGLEIVQKIQNKNAREHISGLIMDGLAKKFHLGGLQ
jgi:Fe-S cluster assembly protein SufD